MEFPFVSRKKYDEVVHKLETVLCCATLKLSKASYPIDVMTKAVGQRLREKYDEGYQDAKKEVAAEVIARMDEKIDEIYERYVFGDTDYSEDDVARECAMNMGTEFSLYVDELKKKYIGEDV